jgi:hypothetical protein
VQRKQASQRRRLQVDAQYGQDVARPQWSQLSNPPSFHLSSHTNKPRKKAHSLQALSLTNEGQCGVNGERGGGGNWGTTIKAPLAWIKAGRRLPKGYVGGTRPYTSTRERGRGVGGGGMGKKIRWRNLI